MAEEEEELVEQLRRVQSDVGFRKQTRHQVKIIALLVVVDLIVSILSITGILFVRDKAGAADSAAVVAQAAATEAQRTADQLATDRVKNSRGSCIQYNVDKSNQREAQVQGLIKALRKLYGDSVQGTRFINDFEPALRESVTELLPYRNCSDEGIKEFLENPPTDPAEGG